MPADANAPRLTLDVIAERLRINIKTLNRRLAEAGIRGIKPGRERLLTEVDFANLVEHLDRRATSLTPRSPLGVPVAVRRQLHRSETKWLLQRVKRPVTKIDLGRS